MMSSFRAQLFGVGQNHFDLIHKLRNRHAQNRGQLEDSSDARAVAAKLQQRDVVALQAGFMREEFLRQRTLFSQFSQHYSKRNFWFQIPLLDSEERYGEVKFASS